MGKYTQESQNTTYMLHTLLEYIQEYERRQLWSAYADSMPWKRFPHHLAIVHKGPERGGLMLFILLSSTGCWTNTQ